MLVYLGDQFLLLVCSEWIAYFGARYNHVGWLVDKRHSLSIADLPSCPLKRMGGIAYGGDPDQHAKQLQLATDQAECIERWSKANSKL